MNCDCRRLLSVAACGCLLGTASWLRAEDDLPSWDSRETGPPPALSSDTARSSTASNKKPKAAAPKPKEEAVAQSKPAPKPEPKPQVAATKTSKPTTTTPAVPDFTPAPVSTKPSGLAKAEAQDRATASATNVTNLSTAAVDDDGNREVGSDARPVRLNSKHALTRPRFTSGPPGHHDRDQESFEPRVLAESTPAEEKSSPGMPPLPDTLATLDNRPPKEKFMRHTVESGDTLWGISRKYHTTVVELKETNHLDSDLLSIGQVLLIPQRTSAVTTPAPALAEAAPDPAPVVAARSAEPVAPAAESAAVRSAEVAAVRQAEVVTKPAATVAEHQVTPACWPPAPAIPDRYTLDKPHSNSVLKYPNTSTPTPVMQIDGKILLSDGQRAIVREAHRLAERDIDYNEGWRPPGEKDRWAMDCSNTVRYLYKAATGITLPRTASSQYYTLRQKKRCWNVPLDDQDRPSISYLQHNLQVGDLLFWEHTYKPARNPPITHVTIFLGTDEKGRWIMAGSQSYGHGLVSDDATGPDLYVFNPQMPSGGYSGMFGFGKVHGRFVAHGRPLPDPNVQLAQR